MNIHISHAHNLIFQKFLQIYVVYGEYINNRSIQHTYPHTTIRTKSLLMQSVLIFTKVFIQSSWDFDMSYNSNNINNKKNIFTLTAYKKNVNKNFVGIQQTEQQKCNLTEDKTEKKKKNEKKC